MTVMFDRYFGIPQHVVRAGVWSQMKPSEQSLYVCLMHDSERYSTRQLRRTDAVLCGLTGLSARAFCNARKKLQERGLVRCRRGSGNVYVYTLCDPQTSAPWPGDPKQPIRYQKKSAPQNETPGSTAPSGVQAFQPYPSRDSTSAPCEPPLKSCIVPLKF